MMSLERKEGGGQGTKCSLTPLHPFIASVRSQRMSLSMSAGHAEQSAAAEGRNAENSRFALRRRLSTPLSTCLERDRPRKGRREHEQGGRQGQGRAGTGRQASCWTGASYGFRIFFQNGHRAAGVAATHTIKQHCQSSHVTVQGHTIFILCNFFSLKSVITFDSDGNYKIKKCRN